jgi:hypothetical protein
MNRGRALAGYAPVGTRSRAIRTRAFRSVFFGFCHPASAPPQSSCSHFLDAPARIARERAPTVANSKDVCGLLVQKLIFDRS